jgi:hypothetical protein
MKTNTKKVSSLFAFALAFALCFGALMPQTATAQSGSGTGTVTAQGKGLAWFSGSGAATVSGSGELRIRDYGNDAQVNVQATKGVKRVLANGWTRYIGFEGTVTITGDTFYVELGGANINMSLNGTGKYVLRGAGTFSTATEAGSWTTMTKTL